MKKHIISGEMKIWDVILDYPETYGIFRQFGYPDIRKGEAAVTSHFMKLRTAAHAYHFDLDRLLEALNDAIAGHDRGACATRH